MARLGLSLLGSFEIRLDGEPAVGFDSNRVRALKEELDVEPGAETARLCAQIRDGPASGRRVRCWIGHPGAHGLSRWRVPGRHGDPL